MAGRTSGRGFRTRNRGRGRRELPRGRIALNLTEVPYSRAPVDLLTGEQTGVRNLGRNPLGLDLDGLSLTQSLAMLEYLDEVHTAGFLPGEPAERVRVRALSYAVDMEIQSVCNLLVVKFAVGQSNGLITTEDWMRHWIPLGLQGMEATLDQPATATNCHGDQITMADICLFPQLYNALRWGVDLTRFDRMSAIADRLHALPAVAAAHPDLVRPVA